MFGNMSQDHDDQAKGPRESKHSARNTATWTR
jgi:hypothetical protein